MPVSVSENSANPRSFDNRVFAIGVVALTIAGLLAGCSTSSTDTSDDQRVDCISDFNPGTDYYPEKLTIGQAENLDLEYHKSYVVATIDAGAGDQRLVLVHCGAPTPDLAGDLTDATVIQTPVTSMFVESSTQLAALDALDQLDTVTGFSNRKYAYGKAEREQVDDAKEFARTGQIDPDVVIGSGPDLLVTDRAGDPSLAAMARSGVPVLTNADWLETDPLGRAEWVKLYGALTHTESQAADIFAETAAEYGKMQEIAAHATARDAAIGMPFEGTWMVPGGRSYTARLLADAHIAYPWSTTTDTGSTPVDIETMFSRSGSAPLAISSENITTLAEAKEREPRLGQFAAYRDHRAWASSARVTPDGANDYFELGAIRPDLSLADLIAIAHPELLPGHEFTFYRQLT